MNAWVEAFRANPGICACLVVLVVGGIGSWITAVRRQGRK